MSSRHPFFRLFLMLTLLLNGLGVAHAAVGHALMQLPAVPESAAMDDCHDMAGHSAAAASADNAPQDTPHKGVACCQGSACNCACALQMPVSFSAFALHAYAQSVSAVLLANTYRSIDLSLILRPPIA